MNETATRDALYKLPPLAQLAVLDRQALGLGSFQLERLRGIFAAGEISYALRVDQEARPGIPAESYWRKCSTDEAVAYLAMRTRQIEALVRKARVPSSHDVRRTLARVRDEDAFEGLL